MRLVVLAKGNRLTDVRCREEAVYVGSDEACEICLRDPAIASQLGVIYAVEDNVWVFEQLEEQAQVQLNGATITERVQLRSGDQLKIHDFIIRAESEPVTAAKRATPRTSVANLTRFVQYRLPPGTAVKRTDDPVTVQPEQMTRVAQMNVALGQCGTIEELMEVGLATLLEVFGAYRAWVGVRHVNYGPMEYVEGRLCTGHTTDLPELGENLKPRVLDRAQFVLLPYGDDAYRASTLIGPLMGSEGALGMVFIDAGETDHHFDMHEFDFFILLLNTMAAQLDAIFKRIAKTRAAMLEGEVTVAHAIQSRLTPRKLPQWDELQFGAFREMGRERTSDIYDIVRLPNEMAAFMIAYTSATGPIPSMLMAQAQGSFRVAAMHMDPPHLLLRSLNHTLYDGTQDHPLDCVTGIIDPSTGNMRYARAGRMGAYIIGNRGEERSLGSAETAPPLATVKNASFKLYPEQLEPSETLVLFTPGVVTARNSKGEIFGEDRFVNILCDGFSQLASNMLKEMLHDLRQFTEAGTQPDDITVILAHRL